MKIFLLIFFFTSISSIISTNNEKSINLDIYSDYLRNIINFPLEPDQLGEITNQEPNKCNNFNYRMPNTNLKYIVQHHTYCNYSMTINIFLNLSTSAHFVIKTSGLVEEFVSPNFRAYHAGNGKLSFDSKLNPENLNEDMNRWSIGIENVNNGKEPFSFDQIQANLLLCDKLCDEIPSLDPLLMIAHTDWASLRKIDVSVFFPWELFASAKEKTKHWKVPIKRNFGVFPRMQQLNLSKNPDPIIADGKLSKGIDENKIIYFQRLLQNYGYSINDNELGQIGESTKSAIFAYNIHFKGQEIIKDKLEVWNKLVDGEGDPHFKEKLINFNENDLMCLTDILEQFPNTLMQNQKLN